MSLSLSPCLLCNPVSSCLWILLPDCLSVHHSRCCVSAGACIIRSQLRSHCSKDYTVASHDRCRAGSHDQSALHKACVNEQWGMSQPSKHSSPSPAPSCSSAGPNWVMLGLRNWGSGERGRRDGVGWDGGTQEGLRRNRSSSCPGILKCVLKKQVTVQYGRKVLRVQC